MLETCHAYVAARGPDLSRRLVNLARRLGFGTVSSAAGPDAEPFDHSGRRLSFFLLHGGLGDEKLQQLLVSVRRSNSHSVRFAPVVIFAEGCSYEQTMRYYGLGYDDVIDLPERRDVLVSRLATHLNSEIAFFETASYFGPERRRTTSTAAPDRERRAAPRPHIRYLVVRSTELGIMVIEREQLGHAGASAPDVRAPALSVGEARL